MYERWNDVGGLLVKDLLSSGISSRPADVAGIAPSLELPRGDGKGFGVRMRGFVVRREMGW